MSSESIEDPIQPLSRRDFLDVLSKTVIATAAFCLVPSAIGRAVGAPGHFGGGRQGGPGGPSGHNPPNPYHPYCDHGNPQNPYNSYNPYSTYGTWNYSNQFR